MNLVKCKVTMMHKFMNFLLNQYKLWFLRSTLLSIWLCGFAQKWIPWKLVLNQKYDKTTVCSYFIGLTCHQGCQTSALLLVMGPPLEESSAQAHKSRSSSPHPDFPITPTRSLQMSSARPAAVYRSRQPSQNLQNIV